MSTEFQKKSDLLFSAEKRADRRKAITIGGAVGLLLVSAIVAVVGSKDKKLPGANLRPVTEYSAPSSTAVLEGASSRFEFAWVPSTAEGSNKLQLGRFAIDVDRNRAPDAPPQVLITNIKADLAKGESTTGQQEIAEVPIVWVSANMPEEIPTSPDDFYEAIAARTQGAEFELSSLAESDVVEGLSDHDCASGGVLTPEQARLMAELMALWATHAQDVSVSSSRFSGPVSLVEAEIIKQTSVGGARVPTMWGVPRETDGEFATLQGQPLFASPGSLVGGDIFVPFAIGVDRTGNSCLDAIVGAGETIIETA